MDRSTVHRVTVVTGDPSDVSARDGGRCQASSMLSASVFTINSKGLTVISSRFSKVCLCYQVQLEKADCSHW